MSTIFSKRHWKRKEQARAMRGAGKSYGEITHTLSIAKSTVSLWCRDINLSQNQKQLLKGRKYSSLVGIRAIQKHFWGKRCTSFYQGVGKITDQLNSRDRFIAGLMLYWAEGNKGGSAAIANSDPRLIIFMVQWFNEHSGFPPTHLSAHLHLHSGQNEQNMRNYWSNLTGIPLTNFRKSFVKPEGSGYKKHKLYNGTIKITAKGAGSTYLLFEILGAIAGVLQLSNKTLPVPEDWIPKLPYA